MICPRCKSKNDEDAVFCEKCGASIVTSSNISNRTTFIMIITVFVIVGVIGAGLIIVFSNTDDGSNVGNIDINSINQKSGFPVSQAPDLASKIIDSGEFETISYGSLKLTKNQCLYILSKSIVMINNGENGNISLTDFGDPANPYGTLYSGTINKDDYVSMAERTCNWMENNGVAPNYIGIQTPGQPDLSPDVLLIIFSNILIRYESTEQLPSSISF